MTTQKQWQALKVQYCKHAGCQVALEAEMLLAPEQLGEQPPRINAHRCSHGGLCNQLSTAACVWAGTNPTYDPFAEAGE
ncbi:MAG TPA: hypothetical protein PLA25_05215 [Anaerolineaceae bacterium]|jgi:hypothetical protein|nr:hypothetical protein [Anaerolineaceae bacterium]HNZ13482.1 hypothetical protein [Anaerolineaceae bacterium]HOG79563.1 hypothetical protein [Anaerolineaceae bacterium]HQN43511.1 hypothetical protein [Anaerolineaceae bacterium]